VGSSRRNGDRWHSPPPPPPRVHPEHW